ncbi:hypothetical protein [Mucilaginibacter sp. PPCGB 2223]|uniref:hypothetical protein n=1 Tax=Mucilaginibacter sp. PPCGB 2223 TaxID=1886027 RepID=UPI0011128025|nr:hypothetical protein [Mucilaginibacter sp. PPCGB 2223]
MKIFFVVLGAMITLSVIVLLAALFGIMFSDPQSLFPVIKLLFALLAALCTIFVVVLCLNPHGKRR